MLRLRPRKLLDRRRCCHASSGKLPDCICHADSLLSVGNACQGLGFRVDAGADASSEGVQRDLLPIIEGSVVNTKLGNISTDHILFICSGAFHQCKPSDMLAELQGRLPIRVELKGLT